MSTPVFPFIRVALSGILGALALASVQAQAAPLYSQLVVIGDSLSDPGNFSRQFDGLDPYTNVSGRFSNGPVAAERLADRLGLVSSQVHNYAVGGSQTGTGNLAFYDPVMLSSPTLAPKLAVADLPGLVTQANRYLSTSPVDPGALYLVWGGTNDLAPLLGSGASDDAVAAVISDAIHNLTQIAGGLLANGAQHLLLPNLPNLGLTPGVSAYGAAACAQATALSLAFNGAYSAAIDALDAMAPGAIVRFDVFSTQTAIVENPTAYGLTDGTDGCLLTVACASNPAEWNSYFYWDTQHPTNAVHTLLGDRFYAAVGGVPEPGSLPLIAVGLAAGGFLLRRKK